MGWTGEQRAEAVEAMAAGETLASVHHRTGIPRSTLSDWASKAGVDLGHTADKTRGAAKARIAKAADRRADQIETLGKIADLAMRRELELVLTSGELRDVVGARTRAIHDAELLAGRATSRTDTTSALDDEIRQLTEALADNDDPVDAA